jgi:multimeric flavodoxin WrbA
MKAVGIVASPRSDGNTAWAVRRALEGTGAESRVFSMNGVGPCTSCLGCKRGGRCVLKDPMAEVYAALEESDLLVLGCPIYLDHVSAQAWIFLNRLYPYIGPAPALENRWKGPKRCLLAATQGREDANFYRPQLDELAAAFQKYWAVECVEHLAIGGCRRDVDLDARPGALAAARAAGQRLAEGGGGMADG